MLGLIRSKGAMAARQSALASGVRAASTVGGVLDEAVEKFPHKEAFRSINQELRWSFKELNEFVEEFACGLHARQFGKGEVLALWLPNNAENLVAQFAAAKAGLKVAVIDPRISTREEIEFILHDSKASGLLFEPKIAARDQTAIVREIFPELETYYENGQLFRPKNFRHFHTVITTSTMYEEGMLPFNEMFVDGEEAQTVAAVRKAVTPDTPLGVSYSKVEGANPKKGEVFTHADVLKRAQDLSKSLKLSATDKVLLTGESHGPSFAAAAAAIENNCLLVVPSLEYSKDAVAHAMELENCSIVGSGAADLKRV